MNTVEELRKAMFLMDALWNMADLDLGHAYWVDLGTARAILREEFEKLLNKKEP